MNTKRFILMSALATLLMGAQARADGMIDAPDQLAGKTTSLSASDEKFLASLPDGQFPGGDAGYTFGTSNSVSAAGTDGVRDSKKTKSNVKYVYHGYSETTLRRSIEDERVDDGYVQGLLKQRGP